MLVVRVVIVSAAILLAASVLHAQTRGAPSETAAQPVAAKSPGHRMSGGIACFFAHHDCPTRGRGLVSFASAE